MKKIKNENGALHFFGLLGVLAFFVIVWGVVSHWQKVATLSDQVADLSHRLAKVEARLSTVEGR